MLNVTKLWVRSFHIDFLDVFWEISTVRGPVQDSDLSNHEIYNYSLYVLRSEAAMGPYDQIGGPFRDVYQFRDGSAPSLHKWRQFFYKLQIVDVRTGETKEFGPAASLEAPPDVLAMAIIREEDTLFREFVGRRCWLFPSRTFGPRCSCYDITLNRVARSGHLPCFGTGWLGGYLSPVEIFVQFDPNPKQVALSPLAAMQPSNAAARCSSFPPVSPQDILVESENRRWRVVNVLPTQRLRAVVHQELQLHEIARSDIEYSLPIKIDAQNLAPAAERNFRNSQNTENDDSNKTDILTFWGF